MKRHGKLEGLSRTRVSFLLVRSRPQKGRKSALKSCLSKTLKTTEANLIKFQRKIKHNKKICCIHNLGFHAQGKCCNKVTGQIISEIVSQSYLDGFKVKCFCKTLKP